MGTNAHSDEDRWIELSRDGDDDAFAHLVNRFQKPVFNLCFRMLEDAAEAEDAAQEVFLKAFKNMKKYDPDRKFINWILTIASNHCIDRIRKRRFQRISLEEWRQGSTGTSREFGPESSLIHQENRENVLAMINQLGTRDRAAVILHYWYEMPYEDIAKSLSLSVGAVKSRLYRARRSIAEMWLKDQGSVALDERRQDEASTI